MDKSQKMKMIKDQLKSLIKFSSELKNSEFSNFDLTDGTSITSTATDLEVGSEVYAVDDNGNQTPLDDGDYVLNDGRTITVAGNVITAIAGGDSTEDTPEDGAATADAAAPAEQDMDAGLPDDHEADASGGDSNDVASRLSDLEKQIEDILNILKKLGTTQGEVNEQMMSKMKSISNEPGDSPIRTNKRESNGYSYGKSDFSSDIKEFIKMKQKK